MELQNFSRFRSQIYGFSIIWIMLFHAIPMLGLHYDNLSVYLTPVDAVLGYGNIGVDIFLFLSGIFLYYSFQKSQAVGTYMRKRLMRVVLPALVIDGWFWLLFVWFRDGDFFRFFRKITLLSFWINGDQMIWYVSLILLLYVLYPYLYAFFFDRDGGRAIWLKAVLLILAVIALHYSMQYASPERWTDYEIALTRIPVFIVGTAFGKYVYEGKKLPAWIYAGAVLLVAAGICIIYAGLDKGNPGRYLLGVMGVSIAFLLEFVLRHIRAGWIHRCLSFFGAISLELYLSHILVIYLYRETPFSKEKRILEYMVVLIFAVLVAYLGRRICDRIEKKLIQTKT